MVRLFIILMAFVLNSCSGNERETAREPVTTRDLNFTSQVSFIAQDGQVISTVRAAIADDDHTRSAGLMDVHNLPDDAGMLFIFDDDEPRSFWMANTPIPLDIIFANSDFEIVRIHRNTAPYSHQSFRSEEPAKYVVEVNAGYTLRYDITEGMKISFPD
jgi:uncharacterized membrane protein (UPF0127 family)